MREESSALAVEGVSHNYGARRALDDVSFSVAPAVPSREWLKFEGGVISSL